MTTSEAPAAPKQKFSIFRVAATTLPIAIILVALSIYFQELWQRDARESGARNLIRLVNLDEPVENSLADAYTDSNGDLVANPPEDESKLLKPETLIFSYVGGTDNEFKQEVWQPFLDELSQAIGIPAEYRVYQSDRDQLLALRNGELHVTAVNTGSVPIAVNVCGFVPFCTFADEKGQYGYRMQIITQDDSGINQVKDLKGRKLTFTSPGSNSGFKAPIVILQKEFGLTFGRDYEHAFSSGHVNSIAGIARGSIETACVASDLLERELKAGKIELKVEAFAVPDLEGEAEKTEEQKEVERERLKPIVVEIDQSDFRTIYESERFPPAAFGWVYNLDPEIAKKVGDFFLNYNWKGTTIEKDLGADGSTQFVKVNYKEDWEQVRKIDDATGNKHSIDSLKNQ